MLLNFLPEIQQGNIKSLARGISLIENQAPGSWELVKKTACLPNSRYRHNRSAGRGQKHTGECTYRGFHKAK